MTDPRPHRRIVFRLLAALVVVSLVEGGSWLLLRARWGTFSFVERADERRADPTGSGVDVAARVARGPAAHHELHPFLGFGLDATDEGVPAADQHFRATPSTLRRRSPDRLIVGVFGGSVAEQVAATEDSPGSRALVRALRTVPAFDGRSIEVVCFALQGYKQPQHLLALNYYLALGGELDVAITFDGFNEVALHPFENAPHGVSPIYPRSWWARVGAFTPEVRRLRARLDLARAARRSLDATFARAPLRWSPTATLVWSALRDRRDADVAAAEADARAYRPGEDLPPVIRGPRTVPEDEETAELVAIWSRCARQMAALCRGNGVAYVHAIQPNQYVEGSKPMGDEERRIAIRTDHPYRPGVVDGYPRLLTAASELRADGIPVLDLTQVFATVEEAVYSDSCCHFNALGLRLLGEALGRATAETLRDR